MNSLGNDDDHHRRNRAHRQSLSTADPDDIGREVEVARKGDRAERPQSGRAFLANLDEITVEDLCDGRRKGACPRRREVQRRFRDLMAV